MCGIAGVLVPAGATPPPGLAEAIALRLAHRGPDGAGAWVGGSCALAHRRLRIVAPTAAADQPLVSADGALVLVANGEIYNHRALRASLATHYPFRTGSDSEAILAVYAVHGVDGLARLDGMFAFALWDTRRRVLVLARDRMGKKPLFWARVGDRLVFASEVAALLADRDLSRTLDRRALADFLALNWVRAPATLLAAVRQLPPGTLAEVVPGGEVVPRAWWTLPVAGAVPVPTPAAAAIDLRARIRRAVERRLMADVPFGAFVSGGLDSAVVWREMCDLAGPRPGFCLGFAEATHDERPAARRLASALGAPLREVEIGPEALARIPALVRAAAEPTADASALAVHALAERAAGEVKMVCAGDGADELLAGYPTYRASRLAAAYRRLPGPLRRGVLAPLARALPGSRAKVGFAERARRFVVGAEVEGEGRHFAWRTINAPGAIAALVRPGVLPAGYDTFAALSAAMAECAADDALARLCWADCRHYLPNDMLVKVDRMGMAHGVEVRAPFLDPEVVGLALGLPARVKVGRTWRPKALLKAAYRDALPAETLQRRKAGFSLPLARWFAAGPGRTALAAALAPDRVAATGVLDPAAVGAMLAAHGPRADHSHALFGLWVLVEWCELVRPTV